MVVVMVMAVGVLHQAIAINLDKVVSVKEEVKVGGLWWEQL
jgi:hypothetical protein